MFALLVPLAGWSILATWSAAQVSSFCSANEDLEYILAEPVDCLSAKVIVPAATGLWLLFLLLLRWCRSRTNSKPESNSLDRIAQYWLGDEVADWKAAFLIAVAVVGLAWTVLITWVASYDYDLIVSTSISFEARDCGLSALILSALRSPGLFPVMITMAILFVVLLWLNVQSEFSCWIRRWT